MRFCGVVARAILAAALIGSATTAVAVAATPAPSWRPQAPTYGMGEHLDQPVTASDGTVLRANVYYPTSAGHAARGPFPVLLQQTPYGKSNIAGASALANNDVPYLVDRGYIVVLSDVRGTGDSGGTFGLFDPVQATDGATVARWAARLPDADGRVGLFGESYMGINQFLTVGALPTKGSPVKAIFPIIAANDLYRDTVSQGGLVDMEFSAFYLPLLIGLDAVNPLANPSSDLTGVELSHAASIGTFDTPLVTNVETGGDQAYDGAYYAARSPIGVLPKIVAEHLPTFLVGGWNDLFQHGELLNYSGLQNLAAGRPVTAPMTATQRIDPRYQLMMGPWQHVTTGMGADLTKVELEWFDTWLLGENTPLRHTQTPMHLYQLQSGTWFDTSRWPVAQATPTKLFFGSGRSASGALSDNDGTLTAAKPAAGSAADPVVFTGLSSACDIQTDQWGAGLLALAADEAGVSWPCDHDDVTLGAGPGALTYTTAPFTAPEVLAGPIDATVYATATTTDTELVATVEEVSPSGRSQPLTSGALLGSLRAEDAADSWMSADGAPLLPYHPYTKASQRAVVPGAVTRYDIDVFPTFAEIPTGWRLRVTITTSDTPHLIPTLAQLPHLVGGVYEVQRNAAAASFVNVDLMPVSTFTTPCGAVCAAS
jgi:putative CocE/NonD family hydrolase